MSSVAFWAGIAILVITCAVAIEAYLKRGRKRRTFAETFKGKDTEEDASVPLGLEATDMKIVEEAERANRLSGDVLNTRRPKPKRGKPDK